ncbi:M13 family metallopeptidase [Flavobacterium crassostreae]|uniref:Endothelin-converting protein n=1 Tax=Flavobacterium crassostreae TaxID=1763534 RepID=A0A1B9E0B5_9FLAO|nr:M13 family metallopeptidase [Flavobacterium crassostreae]OCB75392.1 endothelin-converting protein [Flavobacterium crassostreae]
MKKYFYRPLILMLPALVGWSEMQSQNKETLTESGITKASFDYKVQPAEDFFRFVNGTWLDQTEIPKDRTTWGSFNELVKKTDKDALDILKVAAANPKYQSNTDQGKAINLYTSILDTLARNKQGIAPLKPYLDQIDRIENLTDLTQLLMEMEHIGGIGFFGTYVGADDKNSTKNSLFVTVSSLGLPDKEYYLSDDKDTKAKRQKYQQHIARMLQFLGESPAKAKKSASQVLAFEVALSRPRLDRVESRDGRLQYNPMTVSALQKITPAVDWKNYFKGIGFANLDSVIVAQPKYMQTLETIFKQKEVAAWKAYLKWNLINNSASLLSTTIAAANFDFYGKTLNGAIQQRPLEEQALSSVNGTIGEALGKLYVAQMFPAAAKEKAQKMIANIVRAYQERILNLSWMSEETKTKAIQKLNKITIKIGYPDKWKEYAALNIKSVAEGGSYFTNMQNIYQWNSNLDIAKLDQPVDKTEWYMSPQTVNAYYNPSYNEIVFPAAILQPPFYNYQADEAVNYGGIGAVIGHEISHGFDDSGARYNADGNLVDWWTAEDLEQFTALGTALANQYSALEPLPGVHVDGKFTLGENIGDLGGVNAAYDGLQLYLKENKNPGLIDGFTPEQRFFISWATVWRTKSRDEAIKNQVKTDPHSPGKYRAYVPAQNMDAFYQAFSIKKGDGMYLAPESRVKIW